MLLRDTSWKVVSGSTRTPAEVVTGPRVSAARTTSYPAASPTSRCSRENTSGGR